MNPPSLWETWNYIQWGLPENCPPVSTVSGHLSSGWKKGVFPLSGRCFCATLPPPGVLGSGVLAAASWSPCLLPQTMKPPRAQRVSMTTASCLPRSSGDSRLPSRWRSPTGEGLKPGERAVPGDAVPPSFICWLAHSLAHSLIQRFRNTCPWPPHGDGHGGQTLERDSPSAAPILMTAGAECGSRTGPHPTRGP